MIPYGRQSVTQGDIDAVVEILRSDFLTQGPTVPRFEQSVARRVAAKHAVAFNSATSALHVACLALGLGPRDRFWTVPNTFVASANCGRYCGAQVDFVDIDPVTSNLSVLKLRERLIQAKKRGELPKIVIPVHFAGQPTEQESIWALAQEFGFKVVEDASHALGASRNGEPVGSCRWSEITVFSFHPVKIITTGEGGMGLTNDSEIAERMAMLRSHGITRDITRWKGDSQKEWSKSGQRDHVFWYYEQQMLGYNYRMTDIQAALGISQLKRLDSYIEARNALAVRYENSLTGLPLQIPTVLSPNRSSFHLYVVRLNRTGGSRTHGRTLEKLRQLGIGANLHYIPVHLQPYYRDLGFHRGQFPEAERHAEQAITLPLYPTMTNEQQDRVIDSLRGSL